MADPTTPIGFSTIHLPDLRGGTALVTGASRGISRAVIEALAAHEVRCYHVQRYASKRGNPASLRMERPHI